LDNRTLDIRRDANISEFNPLFVIDGEGAKRMTASTSKPRNLRADAGPAAADAQKSPVRL
jgi:hypothetical protein